MRCRYTCGGIRGQVCESITPVTRLRAPLFVLACLLGCLTSGISAQEVSERHARLAVSQNLADDLFLGTLNADAQYAILRHWTLGAGARYNNWTWRYRQDAQFESRQKTFYVGTRWWPWYTYSGLWVRGLVQTENYARSGVPVFQDGKGQAWGMSLSAGYSLMLLKWLNLDLGAGVWGGRRGLPGGQQDWFAEPEIITVGLMFVF